MRPVTSIADLRRAASPVLRARATTVPPGPFVGSHPDRAASALPHRQYVFQTKSMLSQTNNEPKDQSLEPPNWGKIPTEGQGSFPPHPSYIRKIRDAGSFWEQFRSLSRGHKNESTMMYVRNPQGHRFPEVATQTTSLRVGPFMMVIPYSR